MPACAPVAPAAHNQGRLSPMSTTTEPPLYDCGYCGARFSHAPVGSFCSDACRYRHRGEKALNAVLDHGHVCNTCFGRLRTVEPAGDLMVPGPDYPAHEDDQGPKNVADGFQHPTPRTTTGVDEDRRNGVTLYRTRWSCTCGTVDPSETHAIIQRIDLWQVRDNLLNALRLLATRDAIDTTPDGDAYYDAIGDHPYDAAYACGRALCDAN